MSRARAIYAYEAANGEELTIGEDDLLLVYEKDDEWLLVKIDGGDQLGYVPANYVQEEEGSAGEAGFAQAEVRPRGEKPPSDRARPELMTDFVDRWYRRRPPRLHLPMLIRQNESLPAGTRQRRTPSRPGSYRSVRERSPRAGNVRTLPWPHSN